MQSTGVLNLSIGLTGVKKNRGAHLSYISCPRAPSHISARFVARLRAAARLHSRRRRRSTPPARTRFTHRRASHHRAFFTPPLIHARAARLSRPPTPPVRATAATHHRVSQHHRHELRAAPAPRAAHAANTPRRSRSRSTFSPSARQVFDDLTDRDGSREEEGEGGSCGEARPQADS